MPFAVLFPGQGSQHVGMGGELFTTRSDLLVDTADGVLGWSLRHVCLTGPEDELTRTDRAQPALYATAYALWAMFAAMAPIPAAAAGHSLGEYTALAAAGVFDFATGLRLVAARGEAMAKAAAGTDSGMAALIGGDGDAAEALAADRRRQGGSLWVANLNAPGQVVVAGAAEDIDWAIENARAHGIRRAILLKVAGAFHTPLMAPAADDLAVALAGATFANPRFPVWGNADAAPTDDVPDTLRRQLTSPVRFEETLVAMARSGIDTFVHIGPGSVTAGLVQRTVPDADVHVVSEAGDVADVARTVQ